MNKSTCLSNVILITLVIIVIIGGVSSLQLVPFENVVNITTGSDFTYDAAGMTVLGTQLIYANPMNGIPSLNVYNAPLTNSSKPAFNILGNKTYNNYYNSGYYIVGGLTGIQQGGNSYLWVGAEFYDSKKRQYGTVATFYRYTTPLSPNQQPDNLTLGGAYWRQPYSVAIDFNNQLLYTTDLSSRGVRIYSLNSYSGFTQYVGALDNQTFPTDMYLRTANAFSPTRILVGCQSDFWICDKNNNRILHFPFNATTPDIVLGQPDFTSSDYTTNSSSSLNQPRGMALTSDCSSLLVVDMNQRLVQFNAPYTTGMGITLQYNILGIPIDVVLNGSTAWISQYGFVMGGTVRVNSNTPATTTSGGQRMNSWLRWF